MKRRSAFGWFEFIIGVLLIVLAVITFSSPRAALGSFVIIYGIGAIALGIADIVFYAKIERYTGFGPVTSLVGGIFDILFGVLLLLNVRIGVVAFSILFPFWFIVRCALRLSNLGITRLIAGKGIFYLQLALNILGIILGFLLLFNLSASASVLSLMIGICLLAAGVGCIITAFSRLGDDRDFRV